MQNTGRGRNFLLHGAYSVAILLPGENQADFDELRRMLKEEWLPDGPSEEAKVDSLLRWIWAEKRVLEHLERIASDTQDTQAPDDSQRRVRIEAMISKINAGETRLDVMAAVQDDELTKGLILNMTPAEWNNVKVLKAKYIEALRQCANEPTLNASHGAPEELEKCLKLLERIETNISRQIKDLVQTKAMKQVLREQRGRLGSSEDVRLLDAPPIQG